MAWSYGIPKCSWKNYLEDKIPFFYIISCKISYKIPFKIVINFLLLLYDFYILPGPMERVWENSSGLRSHWDARAADNNLGPFDAHFRGLKYFAENKIKHSFE
jgi:hypothetical protein